MSRRRAHEDDDGYGNYSLNFHIYEALNTVLLYFEVMSSIQHLKITKNIKISISTLSSNLKPVNSIRK